MTQLQPTSFDEKKAAEVAFFFLAKATKQGMHITKLRLVKWMYLAERKSYADFGEPLFGDRLFSMEHGPVVSSTLSLMEHPSSEAGANAAWNAVVAVERDNSRVRRRPHQYAVLARTCPYKSDDDLLTLSDSEISLLNDVWKSYGKMSAQQLETMLHDAKQFPEWRWKKGDPSNPIELEDLLEVLGYNGEQADFLIEKQASMHTVGQAFVR